MRPRPRHTAAAIAVVALALPLGACGREKTTTFGATEGTYLNVGPIAYQVQISRILNPQDEEDRNYMQGVQGTISPDEVWFAIFVRGQNTLLHKFYDSSVGWSGWFSESLSPNPG